MDNLNAKSSVSVGSNELMKQIAEKETEIMALEKKVSKYKTELKTLKARAKVSEAQ